MADYGNTVEKECSDDFAGGYSGVTAAYGYDAKNGKSFNEQTVPERTS